MKKYIVRAAATLAASCLMATAVLPAFAQDLNASVNANASVSGSGTSASANTEGVLNAPTGGRHPRSGGNGTIAASASAARLDAREAQAKSRASAEIAARVNSLSQLLSRLGSMKNISASEQASLQSSLQVQINALATLKASIDADTATTTLTADIQSITKAYRIYVLVEPQARIAATTDRIDAIASQMTEFAGKLQARISAAQSSAADVSAAAAALADYNAKVADAQVQGQAAVTEVAGLTSDNGNQSVLTANINALKGARSKIGAAQKDLVAARMDINIIRKNLPKEHASATTTTSASASQ